eukprot:CAMPEP_0201536200 /NCGR_PEP_ID=MMETSP0161_2-20130828/61228_1 /ASSEMBLY_ACC=CAM_ASM_000251 /TAXON_ID=180227 /ORGANISM="Neoparamoeba aestuarina, Strain SoJaBio B1-5/56/2" /LENGTH=145 /DNA_ID=CAMNT_0047941773 /DNA_START=163 /DNA_END=597 /DNA_ORIENTATION=+
MSQFSQDFSESYDMVSAAPKKSAPSRGLWKIGGKRDSQPEPATTREKEERPACPLSDSDIMLGLPEGYEHVPDQPRKSTQGEIKKEKKESKILGRRAGAKSERLDAANNSPTSPSSLEPPPSPRGPKVKNSPKKGSGKADKDLNK